MPSDDELRRVAEDVRALARSLGRDIRSAVDRVRDEAYGPRQDDGTEDGDDLPAGGGASSRDHLSGRRSAREDLAAAGRAARNELRAAQLAVQETARKHRNRREDRRQAAYGPGPGYPPRWDNWGRAHPRDTTRPPRPPRGRYRREDRLPAPVVAAAPPIRHRHDGTTLAGLLAVVFGLAWLVAGTHLASVSTETVFAVALMVVGATTVVTARTDWALSGRAWPIVGGAVAAIVLLAISASPGLPVGFRHLEFGTRTFTPTAWADVQPVIHGGFGKTTVDLSALPALAAPQTLAIDNAAGPMQITVPDVPVLVIANIAAGQLIVDGVPTAGWHRNYTVTLNPTSPGATLTLRVQSGFARVDIEPATAPTKPVPTPANADTGATLLTPTVPAPPTVKSPGSTG